MKALIDGDVITYQAGFASDNTMYTCPDGHEEQYKKDANRHCDLKNMNKLGIMKNVTAEPIEHCLNSVKKMIMGIKKKIDADDHVVFLTGKGNFREKIYSDYKANRDPSHRPIHYKAIREYMLDVWKADEVIGVEADDAMGWAQWKDITVTKADQLAGESCICTIDKDLNQVPGWHFNWNTNGGDGDMFWVDPEQANRFFFEQWLTGDQADNIPGIPKVGAVTAEKLLRKFEDSIGITPTAREYYMFVMETWNKKTPQFNSFIHTIGDLLWMQRSPGETWDMHLGLTAERKKHEA